jgi:hypothetical protein
MGAHACAFDNGLVSVNMSRAVPHLVFPVRVVRTHKPSLRDLVIWFFWIRTPIAHGDHFPQRLLDAKLDASIVVIFADFHLF